MEVVGVVMEVMEEKERYELFGEFCIKDNNINAKCQLLDTYKSCVILNQQDKRIKELEKALELACNEDLRSFCEYDEDYGYEKQFQMLKEQYKQQAKEMMESE